MFTTPDYESSNQDRLNTIFSYQEEDNGISPISNCFNNIINLDNSTIDKYSKTNTENNNSNQNLFEINKDFFSEDNSSIKINKNVKLGRKKKC